MYSVLLELPFAQLIREAKAQTATGSSIINKYKGILMSEAVSCGIVNAFVKDGLGCAYDTGVSQVVESINKYIREHKTSWALASACENVLSNGSAYNMLNRKAAKDAEKLLEMSETDIVSYIQAGALRECMHCADFRMIAKSVYKNQPFISESAQYNKTVPVSFVESVGDTVYFQILGQPFTINEGRINNIAVSECSQQFVAINSILNRSIMDEAGLTFENGKDIYKIYREGQVDKNGTLMDLEELREDSAILVNLTKPNARHAVAATLEGLAQLVENYSNVVRMDNAAVYTTDKDKFVVIESQGTVCSYLLNSTHSPAWSINEDVTNAVEFIKTKTSVDLKGELKESLDSIRQSRGIYESCEDGECKDKAETIKDKIARLTKKYKDNPAKLEILSKVSAELGVLIDSEEE